MASGRDSGLNVGPGVDQFPRALLGSGWCGCRGRVWCVCLNVCLVCIMCGVCVYARQAVGFPGPEHTHTQDQHKQQGLGQSQPWIDLAQGREGAIRSLNGGCHMWGSCPEPPRGQDALADSAHMGG